MKVGIKSTVNKIMLLQIIWILYFGIIYSYYPKIALLSYLPDVLNVMLLCCILKNFKKGIRKEALLLFLFVAFVGASFVWGDLNWYYVFSTGRRYISAALTFYAASEYLTKECWEKGINILLISQGINVLLTGYQNLVMKLHPDFCNGIFGFMTYDNALQGILSLSISVIAMVYFIDKKWSAGKTLYAIGTSCIVCAFAEIKAYYILILAAFIVTFFFRCNNQKVRRKIINFILIVGILFWAAYKILQAVFPANLEIFFNISSYVLYEEYGARGGAGRLSTIPYIYNTVFNKNIVDTLFGVGLGSAANDYAYTVGKIFISFGAIGMGMFLLWLITVFMENCRRVKKSSEALICMVMAAMVFVTMLVWNGLFTQTCFLVFWILGAYNITINQTKIKAHCN